MVRTACGLTVALMMTFGAGGAKAGVEAAGPKLLFEETFTEGHARWEFTDPACWNMGEEDGLPFLNLHSNTGTYEPEVRSPRLIAWLKEPVFGSFVMDVQARYTGRAYGHADLCFFFGRQDASHFYYVHIATEADPHANSIFLVNGEPRVSIAEKTTDGTEWTERWHTIRIVREVESGLIEVYFDDLDTPIMTATDTTHGAGNIGVGSFDDLGQFMNIRVYER